MVAVAPLVVVTVRVVVLRVLVVVVVRLVVVVPLVIFALLGPLGALVPLLPLVEVLPPPLDEDEFEECPLFFGGGELFPPLSLSCCGVGPGRELARVPREPETRKSERASIALADILIPAVHRKVFIAAS